MEYRESQQQLQMLCRVVNRKEWYEATEKEREKCRAVAKEIHAITYQKWPTHLVGKTKQ